MVDWSITLEGIRVFVLDWSITLAVSVCVRHLVSVCVRLVHNTGGDIR